MDNRVIEKIKDLMSVQGYSRPKLAELSGLSNQTIFNNLTGRTPMTDKTAEKILSVFGLTLEDALIGDEKSLNTAVRGYLEYNGEIRRINSFRDVEKFVEKYQEEVKELPRQVKEDRKLDERNRKIAKKHQVKEWDIVLDRIDTYDCSQVDVWAFRKADDERDGIINSLGNMAPGYGFEMDGQHFYGSEQAYICGLFSHNDPKHIEIQQALIADHDGFNAKKKIRQDNKAYGRDDWETFNIEWMKYVVWNKVQGNEDFRNLLLSVPRNAYIVENSTHQTSPTATIWGAKNKDLEDARERAAKYLKLTSTERVTKKDEQNVGNTLNYIGQFQGKNLMGKILKLCQLALLEGKELDIDYELLRSKNIYLLGKKLEFIQDRHSNNNRFLLGTIAGDMIGYPYERRNRSIKTTDFPLFSRLSKYTDDTVLTIAVMEWLLNDENLTWEYLADRFLYYGKRFRPKYYGSSFIEWLNDENRLLGRESWGNGAAMRVSPVGWFFNSLEEVENAAEIQAKLTHNHPDAIIGAKAAAVAVFLARTGKSKEEIKTFTADRYGLDFSLPFAKYREEYEWTSNCKETVEGALMAFLWSQDFESAIRNAVSLGGDADTLGAITGSIAEAFYGGVPDSIEKEVLRRTIPDEFLDILTRFTKVIHGEKDPRTTEVSPDNSTCKYKAVIFDFDGTLIDTTALDDLTDRIRSCKNEQEKKRLWKELYARIPECKKYDGMDEVLKELDNRGIKTCIVSGSAAQKIDRIVKHFNIPIPKELRFGRYALGRWHPKLKPDPQPFFHAIEMMGVKPEDVIALGNLDIDIIGAKNAGIKSAACTWGAEHITSLLASQPDYIFERPKDLLKKLL